MLKATKLRIYPTPEQADFLNQQFGATRFVYNKALHIISSQYKRHGLKTTAKKDLKPPLVEDGLEAPAPLQPVPTTH